MSPPVLQAIGVTKTWPDGTVALRGVDLEVLRGDTLVLVGESGCGKTTLLRMFNRLVEPSAGEVRILGSSIRERDVIDLRRHTGYVQQGGGLLPHWTVARNVELVPGLLGWERSRQSRRRDELLDLVGLDPGIYAERLPQELSGGQRQRVAFARALAADPDVVLLDEPFGALDAITRAEIQSDLRELQTRLGKTLLMVTHDLEEAFLLGDRVAVMRDGRILRVARPRELDRPTGEAEADDYVARLLALRGTPRADLPGSDRPSDRLSDRGGDAEAGTS